MPGKITLPVFLAIEHEAEIGRALPKAGKALGAIGFAAGIAVVVDAERDKSTIDQAAGEPFQPCS